MRPAALRSDIIVNETAMLSPVHSMLARIDRATPDDAARLNGMVNHPSILPFVNAGHAELDMALLIADPRNAILFGEHGFMVFTPARPVGMIYEAHTSVLPSGRGQWTLTFVRACLHWIFTRTGVAEIFTRCPHLSNHRATSRLAQAIGGTFQFVNQNGYFHGGQMIPADVYTLGVLDWVRTAPGLVERGEWFHSKLEGEYLRMGRTHPNHADDDGHDRHVGACIEMIFGRTIEKGIHIYNRFASISEYAPVSVMSADPLTLDIEDAYLIVRGEDFYVHSLKPKPEREEH